MTCKVKRFENRGNGMEVFHYSCEDVRNLKEEWKEKFRKVNRTDYVIKSQGRDKRYDEFCQEIEDFISKCTCKG
jgi:hypothetical protein